MHTIRGAGVLLGGSGGMVNAGAMRADRAPGIMISPGAGRTFQNDGVMEASGGGGFTLSNGTFVNNTRIDVLDGSRLALEDGTVLQGGVLATAGTGRIDVLASDPSALTLDGVTIQGAVVQNSTRDATIVKSFHGERFSHSLSPCRGRHGSVTGRRSLPTAGIGVPSSTCSPPRPSDLST